MVVVSGGWTKPPMQYANNTFIEPQMNNNEMVVSTTNNSIMQPPAKAVLISRPNSHPFMERVLLLEQPVKVGRSVARSRPTAFNAIFDCKVLSRHHAILWYEDGKFFLQDTKSSNGTFVNNNRLSTTDTTPHEVSSGDIVQFGVDVVENNHKVTHGCIIATLKLFLPDGKEAKASSSITEGNRNVVGVVPLDELYKLNQIIQEASQREQCLETKLVALQRVVDAARRGANECWQAYIGEERLLSRIALLETQLSQANKAFTEDKLRGELEQLQADRTTYQNAAKDALSKSHTERLNILAFSSEQERAKVTAEYEILLARDQKKVAQIELQEVAHKLEEEQKKAVEEREKYENKIKELQMDLEKLRMTQKVESDDEKPGEILPMEALMNYDKIYKIDEENESLDMDINKSFVDGDHIMQNNEIILTAVNNEGEINQNPSSITITAQGIKEECEAIENKDDLIKSKEIPMENDEQSNDTETEMEQEVKEHDYKTLKYQYQSAQNEQKKQIEQLEILSSANKTKIALLEKSLLNEREENQFLCNKNALLKEEFSSLESRYKQTLNETKELLTRMEILQTNVNVEEKKKKQTEEQSCQTNDQTIEEESSKKHISKIKEHLQEMEEEVVALKERYASVNEEKMVLNKELVCVHEKYNAMCNRSHNTLFFYVAPLALMVIYLLVSSMFS